MADLQTAADATHAPSTGPARRQPRLRRVQRNVQRNVQRQVLVAATSALVLLLGVLYVLGPSDASVRMSFAEVASAQRFDADAQPRYTLASSETMGLLPAYKWFETIYGKVDARGVPVSRISLSVKGAERATRGQGATVGLKANRVYRVVLHLRPGKYKLTLSLKVRNRKKSVSVTRTLKNKMHYRMQVTVRPSGVVSFLPVTSY